MEAYKLSPEFKSFLYVIIWVLHILGSHLFSESNLP